MIEPIKVQLVQSEEDRLKKFLKDKVVSIREGLRDLYENRVVIWRQTYEALPLTATREFPFSGASNVVVPIVAIHCDTLQARVMASVFKTKDFSRT